MGKLALGLISGLGLGLIDGASAVFNPEVQSMLAMIIPSATIKGGITGGIVGYIALRVRGIATNAAIGAGVGLVLSVLAAMPTGSYIEIVIPGTLVGVLAGIIVSRFGRQPTNPDSQVM